MRCWVPQRERYLEPHLVHQMELGLAKRRMLEGDTTIQMAVPICCAYLSFFVNEAVLHVSGVISCVLARIVLNSFASPLILHRKTIDSIWGVVVMLLCFSRMVTSAL